MTKQQIDLLADWIIAEVPGEPSESEGAGDTAIRLLKRYREALKIVMRELGVPTPGYPAPVGNAYEVARDALRIDEESQGAY